MEQAAQPHEHEAHGAVAPDIVLDAFVQGIVDHRAVHRVEHDDAVILHAHGG